MTLERWLPVPDFENIYSVSDLGRIRRETSGKGARAGRILMCTVGGRGYRTVTLWCDGRRRTKTVHVLVALVFLGPRPEGHDVRHLDGDRLNNRLSNLAYGTRSDNLRDSVRHGTHPDAAKTHCKRGHPFTSCNTRIESSGSRRCLTCERQRRDAA